MSLMLRASTLGLSLPLPNIFAIRSYRRLYEIRKRWAPQPPCGASGNSNSSSLAATNPSTAVEVAHLSPSIPLNIHQQQQGQVELDVPENIRVVNLQRHLRVVSEDVGEGVEDTASSALPVSSLDVKLAGPLTAERTKDMRARQSLEEEILAVLEDQDQLSSFVQERQKNGDQSQVRFITDPSAYAAGKPWSFDAVRPVEVTRETLHHLRNVERGIEVAHDKYDLAWRRRRRRARSAPAREAAALKDGLPSRELPSLMRKHMDILSNTTSVDQAWDSYVFLIDTIASHPVIYSRLKYIPYSLLHRFSRLLAHNRPRTYLQYLRLLSVMTYIVHCGGELKREQWNALIVLVASGRRKTTSEDVEKAMVIFRGMKTGRLPGSSSFRLPDDYEEQLDQAQSPLEPDVYTLTTLLTIAARAMDVATLKSISHAMTKAGLVPNRITHLSLLRYFTYKKDLSGVRRTLQKMRHQGLELGLDGLNACIWAYGYNNRLDIVLLIYRVLRHNKIQETYLGPDDIHDAVMTLREESIIVDAGVVPNHVTYTAVIQTMAYHGHFEPSIKVFIDMLSMENTEQGAPLYPSETGDLIPALYTPSMAIYRAVFLGFARNGIPPRLNRDPETPNWTMDNLKEIFERFLALPQDNLLTHSVLDIIMSAFTRTSGNDLREMRKAWLALDDRFGIDFRKAHSESRLARLKRKLFPDDLSEPD